VEEARVRRVPTADLAPAEVAAVRALLEAAFLPGEDGPFTDDDWLHSIGGIHFLLDLEGRPVAHASVIERELHVGGRPLRTGYVEAVAVDPAMQGLGLGTRLMEAVGAEIRDRFELGALGTGSHHFYQRLGWRTWLGPSSVRLADGAGTEPSPDDDGYILVLETPTSPELDVTAPISCEWRPGDSW
jgi:aminoglycoside 2'-N-acetyltransferase I